MGHPRGTHSHYVIGCCLTPLGICGLKNNSRRITYGIGCVWGDAFSVPFILSCLKPILLVRGFIENTCSGDGAFDQLFSAKRLRGSSYIATSLLNPLRHPELTISQQHVPSKDIAIFPNLPAQEEFA